MLRAFDLLLSAAHPQRTFVKGRRRNRPVKDALFTLGMEVVATTVLGAHLGDINAQPKAFHRSLLELAMSPPVDLSLDLYFLSSRSILAVSWSLWMKSACALRCT